MALEAVALLGERNSLRAIARVKHCKPDTVLHWLDLAGEQCAAVRGYLIRGVHVSQAQIDEQWTFVKKSKRIWNRTIRPTGEIRGFGGPWPCPVGCGWSVT